MSAAQPTPITLDLPSGVTIEGFAWSPRSDVEPGRPWVLAHGLASNARMWDGVARRLADDGHPVVAVNQRGHGRSSKPDDGYDMATVADDLAHVIDVLGWERPNVAGQSWGGNVVIEMAARHPEAVSLVVCVDGGFIDLRSRFPEWSDAEATMAPPRLAGSPLARITAWVESEAADWPAEGRAGTLANFETRDDGTIAPWLTFDRHLAVLRGLWEHDVDAAYDRITVPVLFIVADSGEASWAAAKTDLVAAVVDRLDVARAVVEAAHHDIHAQKPDVVHDLMSRAMNDPTFFDTAFPPSIADGDS